MRMLDLERIKALRYTQDDMIASGEILSSIILKRKISAQIRSTELDTTPLNALCITEQGTKAKLLAVDESCGGYR